MNDPKGDRANSRERRKGLAGVLALDEVDLGQIAYQLLHRAAVPFLEAKGFNAAHAVLLVHSFSSERAHLLEFQAFARLLGAAGTANVVESVGAREGVERYLCWVADEHRPQAHQGEPEAVLLEALD